MRWSSLLKWKYPLLAIGIVGVIGMVIAWSQYGGSPRVPSLNTVPVQRGNLLATVTATGTIEPEEVVDVGAQVVGIIQEFGRDPKDSSRAVDFGTAVEEGTVLARIDDSLYRARLDKAAAQVEHAKAQVAQCEADLLRAEANAKQSIARHNQADRDWTRAQKSFSTGTLSQQDYDASQSAFEVTKADLAVFDAAIRQARAALNAAQKARLGAEADCREAQKNLDYTTIRSPVKGVIVDRRVNVGQTVVSSLNAPSLFLIAKDLRRLQVWASVNEADIGRVRPGQPVAFTVDAFAGEVFRGEVTQIRLNATMTQNVVTYTVVVTTNNPGGRLLPYLTATLKFETGRRENALLIPNAALRWFPQGTKGEPPQQDRGIVWVPANGSVRRVEIRTGLTDGLVTEVIGGELVEGQEAVVSEATQTGAGGTTNPFTPNIFGGKK
ncbi:MAG: efflux RND transporter periplasmic adaptor subunit [Planctomycetes bacterium]|nr:efflux RND transporter periplasmic adaptor subunit [Planctomycetota bacterium]